MQLADRDRAVLKFARDFGRVTARQIQAVAFADVSETPRDRCIKRLTEAKLLQRYERQIPGSIELVYGIPRSGQHRRHITHTLTIAQIYVTLKQWIDDYLTEPECHCSVGGIDLRTDMYAKLRGRSGSFRAWFEADMDTEPVSQLRGRLTAFYKAYEGMYRHDCPDYLITDDGRRIFPKVYWVTLNPEHERRLTRLIEREPLEAQELFTVCTLVNLPYVVFNT